MPFQSQSQARFMYANKPKLAAEMSAKTDSIKALPEKAPQMTSAKPAAAKSAPSPERSRMAMQSMMTKYGKQG